MKKMVCRKGELIMVDHLRDATKKVDLISREAAVQYIKDNQCKNCSDIGLCGNCAVLVALKLLENVPAADVRPVARGKWEKVGEQMLINLENAREQYAELGYPHRKILNLRCSSCRKVTMVDSSIAYDFCPHCGADMREVQGDG